MTQIETIIANVNAKFAGRVVKLSQERQIEIEMELDSYEADSFICS